ncbi:MAG: TolC family protein [Candidatus Omnitrophica bacterium]|nr:TolC family protein [Candidatus Omnitrophota bacterium]
MELRFVRNIGFRKILSVFLPVILSVFFHAVSAGAAQGKAAGGTMVPGTKQKLDVVRLLDEAKESLGREDLEGAGKAARAILDIDPGNIHARKLLYVAAGESPGEGKAYIEENENGTGGEIPRATQQKMRVVQLLDKAKKALENGESGEAKAAAKEILSIDPGNSTAKKLLDTAVGVEDGQGVKITEHKELTIDGKKTGKVKRTKEKNKEQAKEAAKVQPEVQTKSAEREAAAKPRKQAEPNNGKFPVFSKIKGLFSGSKDTGEVKQTPGVSQEVTGSDKTAREDEPVPERKVVKPATIEDPGYDMFKELVMQAKVYKNERSYPEARACVREAFKMDPDSKELMDLLDEIDKDEIYYNRQRLEASNRKEMTESDKALLRDAVKDNAPPKPWYERLTEPLKVPKYELGEEDVRKGRTYSIDECVQIALARTPRLRVAERQVNLAEKRVEQSRREILPELTLKHEISYGTMSPRHYQGKKYQMEIKQNVFDGFEKYWALRQSEANVENVRLECLKIKGELIEEVKKGYYNLDKAIKALAQQEELQKQVNRFYEITVKLQEADVITPVVLLKVKASNMQVDFENMSSEEDVSLARLILLQAMSMDPDDNFGIKPVSPPGKLLSIGIANCYQLALANSPDIRMKLTVLDYYNFDRKMVKAKAWPKVEFNGNFGLAYENYQPLDREADYEAEDATGFKERSKRDLESEWYVGVKTDIPFWGNTLEHNYVKEKWSPTVSAFRGSETATNYFSMKVLDNLTYFSEIEETLVGFDRAKYEYEKAKQDVMIAVKETYFKYRKSLIQMDMSLVQLEQQKRQTEIAEQKRLYGEVDIPGIIDELTKLRDMVYGVVQSYTEYYLSIVGLNKAIGIPEFFRPEYENEEYDEWKKLGVKPDAGEKGQEKNDNK